MHFRGTDCNAELIVAVQAKDRLLTLQSHTALVHFTMQMLGIQVPDPASTMAEIRTLALTRADLTEQDIAAAIDGRREARKEKDFQRADTIRDKYAALGVAFKDAPAGTTWYPTTPPTNDS